VNILDIVLYIRNIIKGVVLLLIRKPLVSNTNNILGFLIDKGKLIR
jgi:hypothetical protein